MFKIHLVSWRSNTKQRHVGNKTKEKWRVEFGHFISLSAGNKRIDRSSSGRHWNTGKGSVGLFHSALHICPHAVNGSSSENSLFPHWACLALQIIKQILTCSFCFKQNRRCGSQWSQVERQFTETCMSGQIRVVLKHRISQVYKAGQCLFTPRN